MDPVATSRAGENVLIVASNFPPLSNAGVHRTLRFARYLPSLGWTVHVLTMDPACYESRASVDERLLDKVPKCVEVSRAAAIFPLEWANRLRTRVGGGRVSGTNGHSGGGQATPSAARSLFQCLKDAVSLPLMTPDHHVGWIPFAVRAGRKIIRQRGVSVIYSSGPPWTNHLVGCRLKRSTGRPWVADFRDPWVGSDFRPIRRSDTWVGRRHQQLERRVIETADQIIVNTPRSRDDFITRYGEDVANRLSVIPNGFDPADYDTLFVVAPTRRTGKLTIAHAGSFYGKRNVNGLIEAVGNLRRAGVFPPESLEIRLIGAVRPERSEEKSRVKAAVAEDLIKLTPRLPHHECLQQLREADVLLLVQVGAPLSVPGKAFEYIALGKPIIALADPGATTDLVEQERLGICVQPNDVPAIQGALLRLQESFSKGKDMPQISAQTRERYDGRALTRMLDSVLHVAIGDHSTQPYGQPTYASHAN